MQITGTGFPDAVSLRDGLDMHEPERQSPGPRASAASASSETSERAPFASSYASHFVPSDWLAQRGIEHRTLERFGVGEYKNPAISSPYEGKIVIPVRPWVDDEPVTYLARDPNPEAEIKYVCPQGFHKHLEVFGARGSGKTTSCRCDSSTWSGARYV